MFAVCWLLFLWVVADIPALPILDNQEILILENHDFPIVDDRDFPILDNHDFLILDIHDFIILDSEFPVLDNHDFLILHNHDFPILHHYELVFGLFKGSTGLGRWAFVLRANLYVEISKHHVWGPIGARDMKFEFLKELVLILNLHLLTFSQFGATFV